MNQWDREEQLLEEELASGHISMVEYNQGMRDLQRDYRDAAEESACNAYENELLRW
jgi:hypothetical protein